MHCIHSWGHYSKNVTYYILHISTPTQVTVTMSYILHITLRAVASINITLLCLVITSYKVSPTF